MEKYGTWTDAFTGIHPFLPAPSKVKLDSFAKQAFYGFKWYILGSVLATLRFPFVALLFALTVALDTTLRLIPIGIVRRPAQLLFVCPFARLLLLFMGFWSIDAKYLPSKRKNPMPSNLIVGSNIGSGHVIFSNHSSYVDIIYLAARFVPQYTVVGADGKTLIVQNMWEAFRTTVNNEFPTKPGQPLSSLVDKSARSWDGPVIVFPEGIVTNGRVLIGCQPVVDKAYESGKAHILALTFDYEELSPSYSVGKFFNHLYFLLGQFSNKLEVKHVMDADIPAPGSAESLSTNDWTENVLSLLAMAAGVRRGKVTRDLKKPFMEYFYQHKKQYKAS